MGGPRPPPRVARGGTGDLETRRRGRRAEGQAVAVRLVVQRCRNRRRAGAQPQPVRQQEIPCPLSARERPLVLASTHEFFAGMTDVERHLGLLFPARIFALQEVTEEALLQGLAVAAVE